jgi:hypothetical protein
MNQRGSALSAVLIIVLVLALGGALGFGLLASSGKADLQKNVDAKIAQAVDAAKKVQAEELQKKFEEESKSPNKPYQSSVSSGSVNFSYPKTWSAYVIEGTSGNQPINGYFHPNQVPGVQAENSYALRVEMVSTDYSQVVSGFSAQSKQGLKATAYIPPKMQGVANVLPGTRFDGPLDQKKSGSMVVMKVRDKTLKIYTESTDFLTDFNDIILASLTYSP